MPRRPHAVCWLPSKGFDDPRFRGQGRSWGEDFFSPPAQIPACGRKHRVTGGEDEPQELVAEIVVHGHVDRFGRAVGNAVQGPRDLPVFALAHLVATKGVDGAPFGGGHQPGARIGRNAGPFGQGDDQRVLRRLLGKVDIPHHAGQARDEPGPFNAKGRFDRLVRFACGHTVFSAKAAGETSRSSRRYQATPSFPRSPSRGVDSSSGVRNSARSAAS
jgi:hypothetical protein